MAITPDSAPSDASRPRLLRDGTVHSTAEPYAEAMIVEDGLVAWVGSDETAEHLRREQHVVEELDRCLVTPAFVGWARARLGDLVPADDGAPTDHPHRSAPAVAEVLDAQAAAGCGTVRLSLLLDPEELADAGSAPEQLHARLRTVLASAAAHPLDVHPLLALPAAEESRGGRASAELMEVLLTRVLDGAEELAGRPVGVELAREHLADPGDRPPRDEQPVDERLVEQVAAVVRAGRQPVISLAEDVEAEGVVARLEDLRARLRGMRASPRPDRPLLLAGFDADRRELWQRVLDTGAQVVLRGVGHLGLALGVGVPVSAVPREGEDPWQLVSDHVHRRHDAVSVRAGFNAQARGAFRSLAGELGQAGPGGGGQLDPGSAATYAIWRVDSLAVQTPDARAAAWSTDVRARTPLLPYLDGRTLPGLVALAVDGVEIRRTSG